MKISEMGLKPEDIPSVLLPYQRRWLSDTSGIKMWSKSRRIGASWCESGDCALEAARQNGENSFYIGYEKDMARGFIEDAADWAKAYKLVASQVDGEEEIFKDGAEDKSIFVFRLFFNSGYKIEALSSKPRNLRSRQGRIIIDEAAWHDDFPAVLEAAKAHRLMGSPIHIITTYNGTDEPYYELEKDVLAGKLPYSRHFTTFYDAIKDGLYKRFCLIKGWKWSEEGEREWSEQVIKEFGDAANQELLCIPARSGGAYFSQELVENCMDRDIPVLRLDLPNDFALKPEDEREREISQWLRLNFAFLDEVDPNLGTYYGMDFGRSGHLSALLFIQRLPNLARRSIFALEMRNVPFEAQKQILFYLIDHCPNFRKGAMDGRGNGQYLSEVAQQKYGKYRVDQIMFTDAWYAENFPKYKSGLEDKKFILPASEDWLQDHRSVIVTNGTPRVGDKTTKGSDGKQRHGDGVVGSLLAWFASSQEVNIIEPEFGIMGEKIAGDSEIEPPISSEYDWFSTE